MSEQKWKKFILICSTINMRLSFISLMIVQSIQFIVKIYLNEFV